MRGHFGDSQAVPLCGNTNASEAATYLTSSLLYSAEDQDKNVYYYAQ